MGEPSCDVHQLKASYDNYESNIHALEALDIQRKKPKKSIYMNNVVTGANTYS